MAQYNNAHSLNFRMRDKMWQDLEQEKEQTGISMGSIVKRELLKKGYGTKEGPKHARKKKAPNQ
jgi:hypothetical protein